MTAKRGAGMAANRRARFILRKKLRGTAAVFRLLLPPQIGVDSVCV
ncbi:MAG: hypothetical protein HAW59_01380 [Betaproteobacteria bacterium]|nr:hypothetical protein [Betaproteobacteria bacterium]